MTNRLAPNLLARLRSYQHAPDEPTLPAKPQHPGVKYNRQLERWYAWRGKVWQGAFTLEQDAIAAACGLLSETELLKARLR